MSWSESEKLNEWILRAYENGKREEQERIVALIENELSCTCGTPFSHLLDLVKGNLAQCDCDPCDSKDCTCQGKRCDFCKGKD